MRQRVWGAGRLKMKNRVLCPSDQLVRPVSPRKCRSKVTCSVNWSAEVHDAGTKESTEPAINTGVWVSG